MFFVIISLPRRRIRLFRDYIRRKRETRKIILKFSKILSVFFVCFMIRSPRENHQSIPDDRRIKT